MQIVRVEHVGIDAAAAKAAAVVARGGLVVYPTDTLYGIGVNALDKKAVAKLRALKAREAKKPLSIMVPTVEAIDWHGVLVPEARAIAERFLPGALTVVVEAREHLPKEVCHNGTIGVRVPDDEFSHAFASMSEYPVTATSANLAGYITPNDIQELILHFGSRIQDIDLIVDDGPRAGGAPSTVVAFIGATPVILREGALTREMLGLA